MGNTDSTQRNSGIDLLRIVSMIFIMVLHVLGKGGVLEHTNVLSGNYNFAWLLETAAYPAVTAFALISGYVGLNVKHRISSIVTIWLQVLFYTGIITVLFMVFKPECISRTYIKSALLPVSNEHYWYISAYVGVFFFMNAINYCVLNMKKISLDVMFISSVLLFGLLPLFSDTDTFAIRNGCSIIALAMLYYIGAYMKRFNLLDNLSSVTLWIVYILAVVSSWGVKILIESTLGYYENAPERGDILISYVSPTMILAGMSLVVIFKRLKASDRLRKLITLIAPLTLGVYLSNAQALVFNNIMAQRFAAYAQYPAYLMLLSVILAALCIFFVGIALDAIRKLIFDLIGIKRRFMAIENYIENKFDGKDN